MPFGRVSPSSRCHGERRSGLRRDRSECRRRGSYGRGRSFCPRNRAATQPGRLQKTMVERLSSRSILLLQRAHEIQRPARAGSTLLTTVPKLLAESPTESPFRSVLCIQWICFKSIISRPCSRSCPGSTRSNHLATASDSSHSKSCPVLGSDLPRTSYSPQPEHPAWFVR